MGDLFGFGSGPFGPGVLPNPGEQVTDGDTYRIIGRSAQAIGAGYTAIGLAGVTAGTVMLVPSEGTSGGAIMAGLTVAGVGVAIAGLGKALEDIGDKQKEAEKKAEADKKSAEGEKKSGGGTVITVPTIVIDDSPESDDDGGTGDNKPKDSGTSGKPNPDEMPAPDDPGGGGPSSHLGDYYPAPDSTGGGGPAGTWAHLYYPNPEGGGDGGPAGVWAAAGNEEPTQGFAVATAYLSGPGLAAGVVQIGDRLFSY
ncbi:MAG: hypothetical protein EOR02_29980 [Mesorhizobium sp.]|nr:MAG: hypothetical protein EOR02_29980 [Mesorhizobium sp.]